MNTIAMVLFLLMVLIVAVFVSLIVITFLRGRTVQEILGLSILMVLTGGFLYIGNERIFDGIALPVVGLSLLALGFFIGLTAFFKKK